MALSAWPGIEGFDESMNSAYACNVSPPTQVVSTKLPTASWKTASSLEGAPLEYPPHNGPSNPLLPPVVPWSLRPPKRGPIYKVPVEILLRISQLVAPPRTRNGLHVLSKLTHICRFWREALMNQPRMWSSVFITKSARRSFVKACLEKSYPVALEVTVEAKKHGKIRSDCTCDQKPGERLLPNDFNPCEWHFQFELLAETKHSNRICALDIIFSNCWIHDMEKAKLVLGSCRFFMSTFPRLVTLTWTNQGTTDADYLFSTSPFVPTLRSLTYEGVWNTQVEQITNLTSFSLWAIGGDFRPHKIDIEAFRLLMCNNLSLESLILMWVELEGDTKGFPAYLSNLKSLIVEPITAGSSSKKLSTTIRVPAFQRLSSLRISSESGFVVMYTLYAAGDNITIKIRGSLDKCAEIWEDLTGDAKPIIHHIRLYDTEFVKHVTYNSSVAILMMDVQTLEVGFSYQLGWYKSFWDDLKQFGTQLKTIRFEVAKDTEPCTGNDCSYEYCYMWDRIVDLVKYRFEQGRPFAAVERMVVSEDDRENRIQAYVWRYSYGVRKIGQYVRPVHV